MEASICICVDVIEVISLFSRQICLYHQSQRALLQTFCSREDLIKDIRDSEDQIDILVAPNLHLFFLLFTLLLCLDLLTELQFKAAKFIEKPCLYLERSHESCMAGWSEQEILMTSLQPSSTTTSQLKSVTQTWWTACAIKTVRFLAAGDYTRMKT